MKIALQEIEPPIAYLSKEYKKIILSNDFEYFPHDASKNLYHEIVLRALGQDSNNNFWNTISRKNNTVILEHITRSRNIFCTTSDAINILHHSSHILNNDFEIIPIDAKKRASLQKYIFDLSSQGNSITGVSIKNMESKIGATNNIHNGILLGIIVHEFILEPNVSSTVDEKRNQNIAIKLFSHQLLPTCKFIARKIGISALDDFCITSNELQSMNDSELSPQLSRLTIFAEMNDLDRKRVTRLLEQQGHELCNF